MFGNWYHNLYGLRGFFKIVPVIIVMSVIAIAILLILSFSNFY